MAFVLLLLLGSPADDAVDKLVQRYAELRTKDDYTRAKNQILRDLGGHATPAAREALLTILKRTRSRDEKVNAILSLGRIADRAATEALVDAVAKRPEPALVEALAQALGGVRDEAARAWLAADAFQSRKPEISYALACAQERQAMPEAQEALEALYFSKASIEVRYAAVLGLSAIGGKGLLEAGGDEDWRIRLAAARAPSHAKALLLDTSAAVRQRAAQTCGKGAIESAVPELIRLVEADPRLRTRHEAALALQSISKKDYGLDASAWRRWWKEKTAEIKPGTVTVARYYDFSVYSDRLLFIVDASGSMNWPFSGKRPTRIEVAREQLKQVIRGIDKKALFNVMVFSNKVRLWQKQEVEADEKNVARALLWAERALAEPDGDTHTYDAMEQAFERNPQFDTIFFLSDGNPSHGEYREPEGVLASVRVWNRFRRARVYAIHLTLANVDRGRPITAERPKLMHALMSGLARETGGEFALVQRPPAK